MWNELNAFKSECKITLPETVIGKEGGKLLLLLQRRERECVCADRSRGECGRSHLVLKTVCSALFMLFCIDDAASPGVGRHVFSAILIQLSSGGMKVMVRRNHFVVASSIFSVLLRPASSDSCLLSANILYRSLLPYVNLVSASPFAEFAITLLKHI